MTGSWPDKIDHDNHARDDNRWVYLFETDDAGNSRNQSLRRNNTSGHVGIYKRRPLAIPVDLVDR
jgi:hypothetical protein